MIQQAVRDDLKNAMAWPTNSAEFKFWVGDRIPFGSDLNSFWKQIKATERGAYAFIENDELHGFGQCYEKEIGARHIACLIVNPAVRGKGFGRQFVLELMEQAFAHQDVEYITLNVYPDNLPARHLYYSLGYIEVGENRGMVAMRYDR